MLKVSESIKYNKFFRITVKGFPKTLPLRTEFQKTNYCEYDVNHASLVLNCVFNLRLARHSQIFNILDCMLRSLGCTKLASCINTLTNFCDISIDVHPLTQYDFLEIYASEFTFLTLQHYCAGLPPNNIFLQRFQPQRRPNYIYATDPHGIFQENILFHLFQR